MLPPSTAIYICSVFIVFNMEPVWLSAHAINGNDLKTLSVCTAGHTFTDTHPLFTEASRWRNVASCWILVIIGSGNGFLPDGFKWCLFNDETIKNISQLNLNEHISYSDHKTILKLCFNDRCRTPKYRLKFGSIARFRRVSIWPISEFSGFTM